MLLRKHECINYLYLVSVEMCSCGGPSQCLSFGPPSVRENDYRKKLVFFSKKIRQQKIRGIYNTITTSRGMLLYYLFLSITRTIVVSVRILLCL